MSINDNPKQAPGAPPISQLRPASCPTCPPDLLWDFHCTAKRLPLGYYEVAIEGLNTGERRTSIGYHPLWELIRLLGTTTDRRHER